MPTEITMAGSAPWGFRISGGGSHALTVSRITPGGKAALDGILQGDNIIAINGQQVAGLQLGELMELIKNTGDVLHLTLLSESEIEAQHQASHELENMASNLHEDHTENFHHEEEEAEEEDEVQVEVLEESKEGEAEELNNEEATPEMNNEQKEQMSKDEWYNLPTYIRKQIRPPKEIPTFKPQVHWLHGKLRLEDQAPGDNACNMAGQQLRNAVMAQEGPIEINAGPINGKITHAQYNTPLNMYSDPQIVTTLMSQAVASGAEIQDASFFMNTGVKIDTASSTYHRVHEVDNPHTSKQSRSFNILTTLLKHPYEGM